MLADREPHNAEVDVFWQSSDESIVFEEHMTKERTILRALFGLTLAFATTAPVMADTVNISTGVADWEVSGPLMTIGSLGFAVPTNVPTFVPATALTTAQQNAAWAPAPTGSNWVSWGPLEGTSCVVGQTPGNGCAYITSGGTSDTWTYELTISAAELGGTSGQLSFVFGGDDNVSLFAGVGSTAQVWNGGSGFNGAEFLACSNSAGSTLAGATQGAYGSCTSSIDFGANNLNADGSLTLTADVVNKAVAGCPACGDPTGFVLNGNIVTGTATTNTPEPSSLMMLGAGLLGLAGSKRAAMLRSCFSVRRD